MARPRRYRALGLWLSSGGLLACSDPTGQSDVVASASAALSVCNEVVPDTHYVDGIPAYDQCSSSMDAAIYSNNGVDTATAASGSDWVRTQWSGGYQCTELAHRYIYFRWGVDWIPNGNAGSWCDVAPPASSGVVQTSTPVHGDLMVFPPGECGADSYYGHVVVVDTVDSGGSRVTFVEQNPAGRRSSQTSCARCFLHVVANDGSASDGGASGAGGGSMAASGGHLEAGSASMASGGNTASTGGNTANTGGNVATTGGTSASAGGAFPGVAGSPEAAGGTLAGTGGTLATAGGAPPATGGASTASGGRWSAAGGVPEPSGGGATATGGASPSTGGSFSGSGGSSTTGGTAPLASGGETLGSGGSSWGPSSGPSGGAGSVAGGTSQTAEGASGGLVGAPMGGGAEGPTSGSTAATEPEDTSSCSCRVPGSRSPSRDLPRSGTFLGLAGALWLGLRRIANPRRSSVRSLTRRPGSPRMPRR